MAGRNEFIPSYHPSRQTTNTGRLTPKMWYEPFRVARASAMAEAAQGTHKRFRVTLRRGALSLLQVPLVFVRDRSPNTKFMAERV